MHGRLRQLVWVVAASVLAGGCGEGTLRVEEAGGVTRGVSGALVLPPGDSEVVASWGGWKGGVGWEDSRRDGDLGMGGSSGVDQRQWVEVRTREHRWTLNGRVKESSRTTTRTIRRGEIRSQ